MAELVRYFTNANLTVAGVGSVLVSDWRGLPDVAVLRALNDAQRAHFLLHGERPYPMISIVRVAGGLPKLSPALRQEITRLTQSNDEQVLCLSYVVPATGFLAKVARSVITGVNQMMAAEKTSVSQDLEKGVDWAIERAAAVGIACDRDAILELIGRLG